SGRGPGPRGRPGSTPERPHGQRTRRRPRRGFASPANGAAPDKPERTWETGSSREAADPGLRGGRTRRSRAGSGNRATAREREQILLGGRGPSLLSADAGFGLVLEVTLPGERGSHRGGRVDQVALGAPACARHPGKLCEESLGRDEA